MRYGVIERLQVTPISRAALLLGRTGRDVLALLVQALILILLAWPFGLHLNVAGVAVALAMLVLVGTAFSAISYTLGLVLKSEDSLAPVLNAVSMPLMLLSGILLPLALAPGWLQAIGDGNPLRYAVDATRALFNGHVVERRRAARVADHDRLRGGRRHGGHAPVPEGSGMSELDLTRPRGEYAAPLPAGVTGRLVFDRGTANDVIVVDPAHDRPVRRPLRRRRPTRRGGRRHGAHPSRPGPAQPGAHRPDRPGAVEPRDPRRGLAAAGRAERRRRLRDHRRRGRQPRRPGPARADPARADPVRRGREQPQRAPPQGRTGAPVDRGRGRPHRPRRPALRRRRCAGRAVQPPPLPATPATTSTSAAAPTPSSSPPADRRTRVRHGRLPTGRRVSSGWPTCRRGRGRRRGGRGWRGWTGRRPPAWPAARPSPSPPRGT